LVGKLALDAAHALEAVAERRALLHELGGLARVVPELRAFGEPVQLGETLLRSLEVKAPSSAAQPTA
jgi:hypothetical protein